MHSIALRNVSLDLRSRTHIMGVVNVTPDSFSDGGKYFPPSGAVAHALRLVEEGADILDIGGESTRPGADSVDEEEELRRVIPVIEGVRRSVQTPISIDTMKASVARAALEAGADIVNDISAMRFDARMIDVVATAAAPVILMHMQGLPKTMQRDPHYSDVVGEVVEFFEERLTVCRTSGVRQVLIDPGIGFGKTLAHNIALLRGLNSLSRFNVPIVVGTSRKSFIGAITGAPVDERIGGTIASSVFSIMHGAHIVRVHDVKEMKNAALLIDALKTEGVNETDNAF